MSSKTVNKSLLISLFELNPEFCKKEAKKIEMAGYLKHPEELKWLEHYYEYLENKATDLSQKILISFKLTYLRSAVNDHFKNIALFNATAKKTPRGKINKFLKAVLWKFQSTGEVDFKKPGSINLVQKRISKIMLELLDGTCDKVEIKVYSEIDKLVSDYHSFYRFVNRHILDKSSD